MLLNTRYTHRLHYFYNLSVQIYLTVSFSGNYQAITNNINITKIFCFTYHTCCAPYWEWWCWWIVRDRPGGRRKTGSYNAQTRLGNGIPVRTVHLQNVRFQNVRFQNVRFQNAWFQNVWNVRFTKRQVYKTSGLQNVRFTKRLVSKRLVSKRPQK
jgi:hypothetical protein